MSKQETTDRLEKYQKLYDSLSERLEKLLEFEKEFQSFSNDLYELETYYHKNWLNDHDEMKKDELGSEFSILGEDTIWDLLSEHYEYNKRLLKVLADELNS